MRPTPQLPPDFQGLRDDLPVTIYKRSLPHWRQENATYFVTFRLNDSLPRPFIQELKEMRSRWTEQHAEPHDPDELAELSKLLTTKQERWLDQGHGSCLLEDRAHQQILEHALRFFDSRSPKTDQPPRYELGSYVIMPNHVHLVTRPFDTEGHTLEKVLQSWKRYSSREINKLRGTPGSIWFEESFDRIVRDEHHLERCLQYIGRNPTKAGKNELRCPRWISSMWRELGWEFRG